MVDLIAKVHGLEMAEKSIEEIPELFRKEVVYRTLLANAAASGNVSKSEELVFKMRDLGFPITVFTCNQLLLLYTRFDWKKIPEALLLMEKENVQPSRFTYELLLDAKGLAKDISGMEEIMKKLKCMDNKLGSPLLVTIAKHYLSAGFKVKAEMTLKEIEGDGTSELGALTLDALVRLYVELGCLEKADFVVQKYMQSNWAPLYRTFLFLLENYARRGDVHNAEKVKSWLSQHGYAGSVDVQPRQQARRYPRDPVHGFEEQRFADLGLHKTDETAGQLWKKRIDDYGLSKVNSSMHGYRDRRLADNNVFPDGGGSTSRFGERTKADGSISIGDNYYGSLTPRREEKNADGGFPYKSAPAQPQMDDDFDSAPIFNLGHLKRK